MFCGLVITLSASNGCEAPQAVQPTERPSAAGGDLVDRVEAEASPTDEAPRTPGGTIYGEVVVATDEVVEALDQVAADPAAVAQSLRGAVRRFEAAARNWKIYLASMNGTEIALLQESRLAHHAEASGNKLRESILRAARDPAADGLRDELRDLLRVLRESLSTDERDEFERWVTENRLP